MYEPYKSRREIIKARAKRDSVAQWQVCERFSGPERPLIREFRGLD